LFKVGDELLERMRTLEGKYRSEMATLLEIARAAVGAPAGYAFDPSSAAFVARDEDSDEEVDAK
jgi:hypothetical protein